MAGFDDIVGKAKGLFEDGKEKAAAAFEDGKEKASAAFEDGKEKATAAFEDGKAKLDEVRTSDKAEEISDNVLGGLANAANKVTGGKYADKVEGIRDAADKKIGTE